MEEYLAIDFGGARVGVARGNTAARLAEPLVTLPAASAMAEIKELAAKKQAHGVVVGLPRNLDGQETKQTKAVRDWAVRLKQELSLPVYFQDEAVTSQLAGPTATGNDAAAAAIILQDFLDANESDRVAA